MTMPASANDPAIVRKNLVHPIGQAKPEMDGTGDIQKQEDQEVW